LAARLDSKGKAGASWRVQRAPDGLFRLCPGPEEGSRTGPTRGRQKRWSTAGRHRTSRGRHVKSCPLGGGFFGIVPRMKDAKRFLPELHIFTQPRKTIREVIKKDPALWALTLPGLYGISRSLDKASIKNVGDSLSYEYILILGLIIAPIGGQVSIWMWSHLVRFSGKSLGGIASRKDIRTALAWSYAPLLGNVILWIPLLIFIGPEMFTENTPNMDANPMLGNLLIVVAILQTIGGVWSYVLGCKTIAEVQGYESSWRGLGNYLLAGLTLLAPIFIIVLVFIFVL